MHVVTVAEVNGLDAVLGFAVRRRGEVGIAVLVAKIPLPHAVDAGPCGLILRHHAKDAGGSYCRDKGDGAAGVFHRYLVTARLAAVVYQVDGAARFMGDARPCRRHLVDSAVRVLVDFMAADEGGKATSSTLWQCPGLDEVISHNDAFAILQTVLIFLNGGDAPYRLGTLVDLWYF